MQKINKILSLFIAIIMVISMFPAMPAFAVTDYTDGTQVSYTNPNASEGYTLTVPAVLHPGDSGNVTLTGTWASNRVVAVTASETIEMVSNINSNDVKTLDVTFANISQEGSNTNSITVTKTISVAEMTDALFGTWEGMIYYNVDIYNQIEYLQVKYKFEYYNNLNEAVNAVNTGAIDGSSTTNKDNASVGVYTDGGKSYVILLKDVVAEETVTTQVDMNINLGGKKLSSNAAITIDVASGNLSVDGRIAGSSIHVGNTGSTATLMQCATNASIEVIGGEYVVEMDATSCSVIKVNGNLEMSNATVNIASKSANIVGIDISSTATGSFENTKIVTIADAGSAIAIKNAGYSVTVTNCEITAESDTNASAIRNDKELTVTDSVFVANSDLGNAYTILNNKSTSILNIDTCKVFVEFAYGNCQGLKNKGTANISNCEINAYSTNNSSTGVYNDGGTLTMSVSNAKAVSDSDSGYSCGLHNTGTATVSDCSLVGTSDYLYGGDYYAMNSYGAFNSGLLTLNDCLVRGNHSGINSTGDLIIDGGVYEGFGHGGIYFCGSNTTSYVKNAILRECEMEYGYVNTAGSNRAGFYIGSADGMVVYMDSCDIYGDSYPIVLRGSNVEQNNTLYISNSQINIDGIIRIDNDTLKLYLGIGNNFTADNTTRPTSVIITDEIYIQK